MLPRSSLLAAIGASSDIQSHWQLWRHFDPSCLNSPRPTSRPSQACYLQGYLWPDVVARSAATSPCFGSLAPSFCLGS